MYRAIVTGPDVSRFRLGQKMRPGSDAMALPVISSLKELCNHPELIRNTTKDYLENARVLLERTSPSLENGNGDDNNGGVSSNSSSSGGGGSSSNTGKYDTIIKVPAVFDPTLSSKMTILIAMLERTASLCDDRFVLVSNYTKTLDLMQAVCDDRGWNAVRLDGSTKNSDRQNIVDQFNSSHSNSFIFLLSSKAGGCGLNLIGANRLVLFDPAWNPATDRQAMARVWRDGQTKSVFIYRMLSTASLEEKIYQRQILKEEVAAAVVDRSNTSSSEDSSRNFSPNELKKLFLAPHETNCDTYDMIMQMKKNTNGNKSDDEEEEEDAFDDDDVVMKKKRAERADIFPLYTGPKDVNDTVLRSVIEEDELGLVTFVRTTSTTNSE